MWHPYIYDKMSNIKVIIKLSLLFNNNYEITPINSIENEYARCTISFDLSFTYLNNCCLNIQFRIHCRISFLLNFRSICCFFQNWNSKIILYKSFRWQNTLINFDINQKKIFLFFFWINISKILRSMNVIYERIAHWKLHMNFFHWAFVLDDSCKL